MSLNASKAIGAAFKSQPIEPGTYPARLVQVIDMGMQPREFKGEVKTPVQEIMLTYELVDTFLLDEDGQEMTDNPRWVSETMPLYHLDSDRAKSTDRYNAIDPTHQFGGDFTSVVGTALSVFVINKQSGDRVYNNVGSVSPMRQKELENCPALVNEPRVFDLDEPNLEIFEDLPRWVQDRIKSNLEFNGSILQGMLGDVQEEQATPEVDIPGEEETPY